MFNINFNKIDELAELAGVFADTDGHYYKKFISCKDEEEYLPVSNFVVVEEIRHLLDTNPEAVAEVGLTLAEALELVERFAALIEG